LEHNFERLKEHILPLSKAKDFETARTEWRLVAVEISAELDNCPCGKQIREHCYIGNSRTGNKTYVGNVCINRFIGIDTDTLFDGLKRIAEDEKANANEDVIEYANERGFLFDREYDFLLETRRKRKLTPKQIEWKRKINRRIIQQIVVQKRSQR
jgi:hypothetical protein